MTCSRPVPPQSGQGSVMTLPEPLHSGQTIWNTPAPKRNDMSTSMAPVPPQEGQV